MKLVKEATFMLSSFLICLWKNVRGRIVYTLKFYFILRYPIENMVWKDLGNMTAVMGRVNL